MRKIERIIVHCSGTITDVKVESIKRYWRVKKRWKNPGYHVIVDGQGLTHILLSFDKIANGSRGFNSTAIHICYIGGIKDGKECDTRTLPQMIALEAIIKSLHLAYPDAEIVGHRDLSEDKNHDGVITADEWMKTCPAFDVKQFLKDIEL